MGEQENITPASMLLALHRDTQHEIRLLREASTEQAKATAGLGVQVHHLARSIEAQNEISIRVEKLEQRMTSQENYKYRLAAWASVWTIALSVAIALLKYVLEHAK